LRGISDNVHSSNTSAGIPKIESIISNGDTLKSKKIDFKIKLIMIGKTNTGKSSILRRYIDKEFLENDACTIGIETKFKTL
jgi:GTPase SAR1 family protein